MKRPRLTRAEKDAVITVVQEFLAGHDAEMVAACGVADSEKEGEKILERLGNAVWKLADTRTQQGEES